MSCHIVGREGETRWDFLALARARPGAEYVGSELLVGAVEIPAAMLVVLVRAHAQELHRLTQHASRRFESTEYGERIGRCRNSLPKGSR